MNLAARLWTYQAERFPVFKTGLLVAFFTAATLCVSAQLADRSLPPPYVFVAIWLSVFLIFFQMRVADEHKDFDIDARYRPERPVPSGIISLGTLTRLGLLSAAICVLASWVVTPFLLLPLALVWIWFALMSAEFFAPDWLKARLVIYLISHMAIMPLIDLYVSAAEWLPRGDKPGLGLWLFYGLSFANGCVLELGRKIWAPENEREGVETYSDQFGPARAVWMWAGCCLLASVLLLSVGAQLGLLMPFLFGLLAALPLVLATAHRFARNPTPKLQARLDAVSGLWVLFAYGLAGFVPLIL